MDHQYPIHTIETECQDCYKCVRHCPVKAIKITDGRAAVVPELCTACGHCVEVCPAHAKRVRDDLGRVRHLLAATERVFVSLAPSYASEFAPATAETMITALHRLGFAGVSETALGAQQVSAGVAAALAKGKTPLALSSACPATVEFVLKYLPDLADHVTGMLSPALAHAKLLRERYGEDIGVVFIGPCVAKKRESDKHPELIDIALTFQELRRWLEAEEIFLDEVDGEPGAAFVPEPAEEGAIYPIEGGMVDTVRMHGGLDDVRFFTLAGIPNIDQALCGLKPETLGGKVFVELLACEGGCINGPCASRQRPGLTDRLEILNRVTMPAGPVARRPDVALSESLTETGVARTDYPAGRIRQALARVGKHSAEDELNCGGCGYGSCRAFATALLDGRAEPTMCLSFLRKQAQKKANALLRCIPSGVVIVNADLRVIECNENFVKLFGEAAALAYEARPGLEGAVLDKIVPFGDLFREVLRTGGDLQKDVFRAGDRLFNMTLFSIEAHAVVGAVILDVTTTELRREQIAQRAREVIQRNLHTVQDVACKLGENMAETEILLRSLAEGFTSDALHDDETASAPAEIPVKGWGTKT